jgi:cytochrome c peroxidase
MNDRAKAVAAGMTDFKDEASIEKKCKTCHNEKSPTYRSFNFRTMWGDIKHSVPEE